MQTASRVGRELKGSAGVLPALPGALPDSGLYACTSNQ
jgi:hypothetical protein